MQSPPAEHSERLGAGERARERGGSHSCQPENAPPRLDSPHVLCPPPPAQMREMRFRNGGKGLHLSPTIWDQQGKDATAIGLGWRDLWACNHPRQNEKAIHSLAWEGWVAKPFLPPWPHLPPPPHITCGSYSPIPTPTSRLNFFPFPYIRRNSISSDIFKDSEWNIK